MGRWRDRGRHPARISDTFASAVPSRNERPLPALLRPLDRTWRQRALVLALARRELIARYRGGFLGFFWSLLNPLLLLLVYATVFRVVFQPRADVRPYALFLFGGVLVWSFVSSALLDAAETFRTNAPAAQEDHRRSRGLSGGGRGRALRPPPPGAPRSPRGDGGRGGARRSRAGCVALSRFRWSCSCCSPPFTASPWRFRRSPFISATCATSLGNLLTLAFFLTPILYPLEAVPERYRGLLRRTRSCRFSPRSTTRSSSSARPPRSSGSGWPSWRRLSPDPRQRPLRAVARFHRRGGLR